MTLFSRLHHVAVSVPDLEATAAWYRDKLDFVDDYRYDVSEIGMSALFLSLGDVRLEIFQLADTHPRPEVEGDFARYLTAQGLKHIAFAVDDLEHVRAVLVGRGVEMVTEVAEVPGSGGERYCFIRDLDGVLVELFSPVADHEPAPTGS